MYQFEFLSVSNDINLNWLGQIDIFIFSHWVSFGVKGMFD
ncbi:hypothetical protein HMPREF1562_0179 [Providencia alcalifaciens F90-2004]|nr:hypothetical protein HMPREF1562_0179 [Providencia alcalifaciens F90-2004]